MQTLATIMLPSSDGIAADQPAPGHIWRALGRVRSNPLRLWPSSGDVLPGLAWFGPSSADFGLDRRFRHVGQTCPGTNTAESISTEVSHV